MPLEEAKAFGVMGVDEDKRIREFVEKPSNPPPMPGQPDKALGVDGHLYFQHQVPV